MASRQGLSLFVGNLPWTVSTRELRSYVSQFGPVAWARVVFDPKTGLSKGYGFVTMKTRESFNAFINKPGHVLEGSHLSVSERKGPGSE
ncbi:31 kDa ribonucleoprotein, chloroplastic-like isoform X2 [Amphibalanus amphitrite]|uniref:31 kDa ribonucleoprotein, chloroplastic-like isoform X2 n=1 Tax=Amphibalanus amphitrite TaxID=1232801 RepID=UPI001C913087|nr:31 kDa ribonucleoprotein, chloroplastic-like isoform X2 [Amphibalanus amphitrite]